MSKAAEVIQSIDELFAQRNIPMQRTNKGYNWTAYSYTTNIDGHRYEFSADLTGGEELSLGFTRDDTWERGKDKSLKEAIEAMSIMQSMVHQIIAKDYVKHVRFEARASDTNKIKWWGKFANMLAQRYRGRVMTERDDPYIIFIVVLNARLI